MTEDEKKFSFASRGQELSGVGLSASLLGDEVRLSWDVEGEQNSKGYIVTKRPGGSEDGAFQLVADYQTPGAMLGAGSINGKYSYVDGSIEPGVWVYRVQEEDITGVKSALSQTIIDIPSNEDKVMSSTLLSILLHLTCRRKWSAVLSLQKYHFTTHVVAAAFVSLVEMFLTKISLCYIRSRPSSLSASSALCSLPSPPFRLCSTLRTASLLSKAVRSEHYLRRPGGFTGRNRESHFPESVPMCVNSW